MTEQKGSDTAAVVGEDAKKTKARPQRGKSAEQKTPRAKADTSKAPPPGINDGGAAAKKSKTAKAAEGGQEKTAPPVARKTAPRSLKKSPSSKSAPQAKTIAGTPGAIDAAAQPSSDTPQALSKDEGTAKKASSPKKQRPAGGIRKKEEAAPDTATAPPHSEQSASASAPLPEPVKAAPPESSMPGTGKERTPVASAADANKAKQPAKRKTAVASRSTKLMGEGGEAAPMAAHGSESQAGSTEKTGAQPGRVKGAAKNAAGRSRDRKAPTPAKSEGVPEPFTAEKNPELAWEHPESPVASSPLSPATHAEPESAPAETAALAPSKEDAASKAEPAARPQEEPATEAISAETKEPGEAALRPEGEGTEKKRRSRGRRGRGRKKSAAQHQDNAAAAKQLEAQAPPARMPEEEPAAPPLAVESLPEDVEEEDGVLFAEEEEPKHKDNRDEGEDLAEAENAEAKAVRRKMFVSVLPEEQIEVVITEEGQVQEYYVEMLHQAKTKGNIYKGIIHNVDPNLQAAFVSYGAVKNGFLQIDEVHPEYYVVPHEADKGRKYPPIQKVLKSGQEVLVQVVKEPAGTKGAFLTTYLSMPGRFLVLTPGREQIGVSRKVENEHERARLRDLLEGLNPGPGLGVIVRTVSMGASKTSLQRDLQYLKRTWKDVRTRGTTEKAPCLVYQEMELTSRAVRDYLTENVGEVWIDDEDTAISVGEVAEALFPRRQKLVRVHKDINTSLFERFNLQRQLDQIHSREVSLPSGGRLVIDATEALTAIDINSGRSGGKNNFEDMAFRTNMEAAKMIPLQLRLRDIGGQVVVDFIEMRDKSHWREVEKALRNGMKVDRARYDVGKIGPFGLLEIVRQRLGSSAISISTEPCPCCNGAGVRRNMEWQSQHALRDILRALRLAQTQNQNRVSYKADASLALHLLNNKRQRLLEMEQSYGVHLDIEIGG